VKYVVLCLLLVACTRIPDDPLVKMTEDVEKKGKGIDIQITPVEKAK
jgi:hypothetical protein